MSVNLPMVSREQNTLKAIFCCKINSAVTTFNNDLSPIFLFQPLHVINNDLSQNILAHDANNNREKDTSQIMLLPEEDTFSAGKKSQPQLITAVFFLKERDSDFKKAKQLLGSNVNILQEQ